ncbi:hypothetical protein BDDG_09017, partial [Blastomyces dermatitidis ATCC 18188]
MFKHRLQIGHLRSGTSDSLMVLKKKKKKAGGDLSQKFPEVVIRPFTRRRLLRSSNQKPDKIVLVSYICFSFFCGMGAKLTNVHDYPQILKIRSRFPKNLPTFTGFGLALGLVLEDALRNGVSQGGFSRYWRLS